jgi:hypothetical protein
MKLSCIFLILFLSVNTFANTPTKSRGNSFNPDIGINLLFLNQISNQDRSEDGMKLQEAELQFSSDVDAYFSAKALFSVSSENGTYGIEPEEAYAQSLSIPHLTIILGKSKMPLGKHNQLHSHAFPFINPPLVNTAILGEEGLNETGIGVSGLIPLPWFSELNLNYTQGENADLFANPGTENKAIIGRFRNLWDLSDSTTLEFGVSGASGKNTDDLETTLFGADLTLKWRPVEGGKYHAFEWASEVLEKDRRGATDGRLSGAVSHVKYQFAQRWYVQYRLDYLGLIKPDSMNLTQRHTALVAFLPSEFSGIRLQYENIDDGQPVKEERALLQFNISMGAHPAHTY